MDMTTLFTMSLGLQAPWEVKDLQFNPEGHRLDIQIDFARGADFPCPDCGMPGFYAGKHVRSQPLAVTWAQH